jgi:hypothetical protein
LEEEEEEEGLEKEMMGRLDANLVCLFDIGFFAGEGSSCFSLLQKGAKRSFCYV